MIPTLSRIIRKKVPEWNERVLVMEDFYAVCDRERVRVLERRLDSQGKYAVKDGEPFIVLRKGLSGPDLSWAAFHELGHHLFHYPLPHNFDKGTFRKMDREANFFASVALIPKPVLEALAWGEVTGDAEPDPQLLRIRSAVFRHFGV